MDARQVLHEVQMKLRVPKKNYNSFAKYHYRNCEDILEAVKGLLPNGCAITLSDLVEMIGDRYYVRATATLLCHDGVSISASAYAREPLEKKGSDASQITGAASSYARKYALNGLFCIDDNQDADTSDNHEKPQQTVHPVTEKEVETLRSMIKSSETDEIKILEHYQIYSLMDMSRDEYTKTMVMLEKKITKILGK